MGFFSSFQKYHDAGKGPNEDYVERFGVPARSLYTSSKIASIHQQIDIMDGNEQIQYQSKSKFFSLRDKTDITDANGSQVAHIEKKIFSLHEKRFITMPDGRQFTLSNELFHIVKDITNIEGLGWQLQGNVLGLNFVLIDENGAPVAVIGQKMLSLHDKYSIDIYQPQHEHVVVAILISLQKMIRERQSSSSGSFSFGSGNGNS